MQSSALIFQPALSEPMLRLQKLPTRVKTILGLTLFLSLYIWYLILYYGVFHNSLKEKSFLQSFKCPACYGKSLCHVLETGQIQFTGLSNLNVASFNVKNVYYGIYGKRNVVLKKLAHNSNIKTLESAWCALITDGVEPEACGTLVSKAIHSARFIRRLKPLTEFLSVKQVSKLCDLMHCPSELLLQRLERLYREKADPHHPLLSYDEKVMLLTTLRINQEPIMLQLFPASEGWPFPEYIGACGRFIVETHCGTTLNEHFNAPFHHRVELAYRLMQIAETLTSKHTEFALYLTDWSLENFALDAEGNVWLIDVENVIVVDKSRLEQKRPKGWDEAWISKHEVCNAGQNCLNFSPDDLCQHISSDHNYYALCKNMLSPDTESGSDIGGLLHDMPDYARDDYELDFLLKECVKPRQVNGRFHAKDSLLQTLDKLRLVSLKYETNEQNDLDEV